MRIDKIEYQEDNRSFLSTNELKNLCDEYSPFEQIEGCYPEHVAHHLCSIFDMRENKLDLPRKFFLQKKMQLNEPRDIFLKMMTEYDFRESSRMKLEDVNGEAVFSKISFAAHSNRFLPEHRTMMENLGRPSLFELHIEKELEIPDTIFLFGQHACLVSRQVLEIEKDMWAIDTSMIFSCSQIAAVRESWE